MNRTLHFRFNTERKNLMHISYLPGRGNSAISDDIFRCSCDSGKIISTDTLMSSLCNDKVIQQDVLRCAIPHSKRSWTSNKHLSKIDIPIAFSFGERNSRRIPETLYYIQFYLLLSFSQGPICQFSTCLNYMTWFWISPSQKITCFCPTSFSWFPFFACPDLYRVFSQDTRVVRKFGSSLRLGNHYFAFFSWIELTPCPKKSTSHENLETLFLGH